MRGISLLAANPLASQEVLCTMEKVWSKEKRTFTYKPGQKSLTIKL